MTEDDRIEVCAVSVDTGAAYIPATAVGEMLAEFAAELREVRALLEDAPAEAPEQPTAVD